MEEWEMNEVKMKKPRNYWNIKTMNDYCKEKGNGFSVIDIKRKFLSGKKHVYALVQCSNKNHNSYWTNWSVFCKGIICKECYYEQTNKTLWNKDKVTEFYNVYDLKIINIENWKNVDDRIESEDEYGFKYNTSLSGLKQYGKSSFIFHVCNPFSIYNLRLYCKLYRPDYELVDDKYEGIKKDYYWKYIGDMLPENEDRIFLLKADSFINGEGVHPYFSNSKGANYFEESLKLNHIIYKKEKTFKGCKDKILLRFDFYIPFINEVIEIDGQQHNEIVKNWGGEIGYFDRLKKDNIKNEYCLKNNILLTRILYNHKDKKEFEKLVDENIQVILNKINKLKQNKIFS